MDWRKANLKSDAGLLADALLNGAKGCEICSAPAHNRGPCGHGLCEMCFKHFQEVVGWSGGSVDFCPVCDKVKLKSHLRTAFGSHRVQEVVGSAQDIIRAEMAANAVAAPSPNRKRAASRDARGRPPRPPTDTHQAPVAFANDDELGMATSSGDDSARKPCRSCGRRFDLTRLAKHESCCIKSNRKTRVFDSQKQRLKTPYEMPTSLSATE